MQPMNRVRVMVSGLLFFCIFAAAAPLMAQGDWVEFTNQTSSRLSAASGLGVNDPDEKDYAWADLDQDGDIDLVVVRKTGWTTDGPRTNVLFMNENGVLVDRTTEFATATDMAGDQGFLTPTNDRDVVLTDVTGDGWLDIVTCTTLHDGDPKQLSHPRIYRNLGSGAGGWQGFRFENSRIPTLAGNSSFGVPHAPRFCSIGFGDIDNDGDVDLYFGDYDSGSSQTLDFNDRLLINDGFGVFTDETLTHFSGSITVAGQAFPFYQSAFGMSSHIKDINGDGMADILKDSALNPPQFVGVSYNNPSSAGSFGNHDEAWPSMAPYHTTAGDLNNDNALDLVITDDNADSYLINLGNNAQGQANFQRLFYAFATGTGSDDGFGGNSVIADLDNDGWNDVIITDVDVDISGCNRRMHIYHNLGNAPMVTIRQENDGGAWRPTGVHDVAVFDIDGDGWKDMVIGTCSGTQVWMNVAPTNLEIIFPSGLPASVPCEGTVDIDVFVNGIGGGVPEANSLQFFVSADGGAFSAQGVTSIGADLYSVTLDGATATSNLSYYFSASLTTGLSVNEPPGGANSPYVAIVADEVTSTVDGFESGNSGWTVQNDPSLAAGTWQLAVPVGTTSNGQQSQPGSDAGGGSDTFCWITQNGTPGGTAGTADVDGGPTELISPALNLLIGESVISFDLWFSCIETTASQVDNLTVSLSNDDGISWTDALVVGGQLGTDGTWQNFSIVVSDVVAPSSTVRVRFSANDSPNNSLVEAGLDNFAVDTFNCSGVGGTLFTRGDINNDGSIDISDPIFLLQGLFGAGVIMTCDDSADANDDGGLDVADAVASLNALFGAGAALPEPSNCGVDPTDDALGCDLSACP